VSTSESSDESSIDLTVKPSGDGCVECWENGGWWFHLRRCTACGHIGCFDTSPSQHASKHARLTGHAVLCSYEPGESWFWDFRSNAAFEGPTLAPPAYQPLRQPVPGPAGRVLANWEDQLNSADLAG
jgi:hypothetical protein